MRRTNFIALDVHSAFCEGGYIDDTGREKTAWHEPTAIPASGLTVVAYCLERGITQGSFYAWKRRLRAVFLDFTGCLNPPPADNASICRDLIIGKRGHTT